MSIVVSEDIRPTEFKPKSRAELFISRIKDPARRQEAIDLHEMMSRVTKMPARMWGPDIVGYGRYRYKTPSGRMSEFAMAGFSPNERRMTVYLNPGYEDFEAQLEEVGKIERGQSCIYYRHWKQINPKTLEAIVRKGITSVKKRFTTWDE